MLDVGRTGAERGDRVLDELGLVVEAPAPGCGARSKPIVEEVLRSIPELPQSEPPRWPGQTSTSSGSDSSRSCSERKMSAAPSRGSTARSGRATSPTNSESPVRTAHRVAAAAGVAQQEGGVLGPVARGVDRLDRRPPRPARPCQPSANGSCSYSAPASSLTWIVAPVARASRPWPETWSAWLWVSSTCSIRTPCRRARSQVGLDVPLRVDHRGDCRRRGRRPGRRRSRGPRG